MPLSAVVITAAVAAGAEMLDSIVVVAKRPRPRKYRRQQNLCALIRGTTSRKYNKKPSSKKYLPHIHYRGKRRKGKRRRSDAIREGVSGKAGQFMAYMTGLESCLSGTRRNRRTELLPWAGAAGICCIIMCVCACVYRRLILV